MSFPFSAVLGMDDLRLALLLNAVSPQVGGVLVRGEKGTAKSTVVRALAALLPPVDVVEGCRFACDPARPDPRCPDGPHLRPVPDRRPTRLVELPVGAAEDRVVGSLDLERALGEGVSAYEPGLLAAAHRGVLYVDEVNLLHDHLVDLLLDAAAMGRCHVEREGVSVTHAASFLLVGTMNPEEGELRPQLLDRFGLTVEVAASREPDVRAEVVRRRLAADADPEGFAARWAPDDAALARRVAAARALLPAVDLPDPALRLIAEVCAQADVDGMRADIVTARTAIAHAAWQGRDAVGPQDVRVAARLALPHRRRRDPFDAPGTADQGLDDALEQALERARQESPEWSSEGAHGGDEGGPDCGDDGGTDGVRHPGDGTPPETGPEDGDPADGPDDDGPDGPEGGPGGSGPGGSPRRGPVAAATGLAARELTVPGLGAGPSGRRSNARGAHGRTVGALTTSAARDVPTAGIHLPATVRAAAPRQAHRGRTEGPLRVRPDDLRLSTREGREGNLVVLVVDASGSMGARQRVAEVKGAVLALLRDAYQRRDTVALVTFRGDAASVVLPPTSSVDVAAARLDAVATGGRTPVAEGLLAAADLLRVERLRSPQRRPLLVVVTDGRATAGRDAPTRALAAADLLARTGVRGVVVDCETGPVRLGLARRLAAALHAEHLPLEHVAAAPLAAAVRSRTASPTARAPHAPARTPRRSAA